MAVAVGVSVAAFAGAQPPVEVAPKPVLVDKGVQPKAAKSPVAPKPTEASADAKMHGDIAIYPLLGLANGVGQGEGPEALARMIAKYVRPETWTTGGGKGTIRGDIRLRVLVVVQPPEIQAEVFEFLKTIGRVQGMTWNDASTPQRIQPQAISHAAPYAQVASGIGAAAYPAGAWYYVPYTCWQHSAAPTGATTAMGATPTPATVPVNNRVDTAPPPSVPPAPPIGSRVDFSMDKLHSETMAIAIDLVAKEIDMVIRTLERNGDPESRLREATEQLRFSQKLVNTSLSSARSILNASGLRKAIP